MRGYISQLEQRLHRADLDAELRIIRSNGGLATPSVVAKMPALTLLSGPAAGVLGGAWTGELSQRKRLITFDVGGTSANIGVVTDGQFSGATARDTWVAGYPVLIPMIDIHTIGAGGGSIAHIDAGGVKLAESLVELCKTTNKYKTYRPPERKAFSGIFERFGSG